MLAADYQIENLKIVCIHFLKNHIADNYDTVFDLATTFNLVSFEASSSKPLKYMRKRQYINPTRTATKESH